MAALVLRSALTLFAALVAAISVLACAPPGPATAEPSRTEKARKPADIWNGSGLDARVLFQQEVDRLPEAPYMLRVTELEMEPGASIDPHTHLGPGVQVVLQGAFTVVDAAASAASVYESSPTRPFGVYYTGLVNKYSTENRGTVPNRLFMAEVLPRGRGFAGNQRFDSEAGPHNRGGIRSGPYVQESLENLPGLPLMIRVTQIDMGPKAKTPEYTRAGPGLFFVANGQATFRRDAELFIATNGAGGYFFDEGTRPMVLENKPVAPNRVVAVEFLPASLGKQPSTVPTGRET